MLEDIKNYRVTLKNLPEELAQREMGMYLPEQLSKLRIIIEYNDCIIQAKDLVSYVQLQDDRPPLATVGHSFMRGGDRNNPSMNYGSQTMSSGFQEVLTG